MGEQADRREDKERSSALKAWARFLRDNHHDYEYPYLLRTIVFKLQRMRRLLRHGHNADSQEVHDEILEVERLLERVLDHDYHAEAFVRFYAEHGRPTRRKIPVTERGKVLYRFDLLYGGKPATPAMRREMRRLCEQASRAEIDDLRKAFRLMAERLFGWWD